MLIARLLAALVLLTLAADAHANFILVTNPSQVNANGGGDWSSLGPPNTIFSSPISYTSPGGVHMTISANNFRLGPPPPNNIYLQDVSGTTYLTAATSGELARSSITFSFDNPIQAFGTYMSAYSLGLQPYFSVEALDQNGQVLIPHAYFALIPSTYPHRFDGYAGISSDVANIYQIRYTVGNTGSTVQIQLGPIDFHSSELGNAVPAPPSMVVFAIGAVGLPLFHRRLRPATP